MHVSGLTALVHVAVLALAQGAPGGGAGGARTGRPMECDAPADNAWERAKAPRLRRYCELLASASAKLVGTSGDPHEVVRIAGEAEGVLAGRAAPLVLRGRALLRLGDDAAAFEALSGARARENRALDEHVAMLAFARAAARVGKHDEALRAFRAVLPRVASLPAEERSAAAVEAGLVVMSDGPAGLDDAAAMLREARRDAQDSMHVLAVVGLALALDRAGAVDASRAVLETRLRADVRPMLDDPKVRTALKNAAAEPELDALRAMAAEAVDPGAAREAWRAYLDGPAGRGPWAEHARARMGARPKAAPRRRP